MKNLLCDILVISGTSIVILIIGTLQTEGVLHFPKQLYGENSKEHRKEGYIPVVVVWVVTTVIFAYLVFKKN